jgi:hypothetical protein
MVRIGKSIGGRCGGGNFPNLLLLISSKYFWGGMGRRFL